MKRAHILLLLLLAAGVCIVVSSFADFSTYETFASASQQPGKAYRVIGTLDKTKGTEYNPQQDPNRFVFYVKDKSGEVRKVVFSGAKPTDIEKSEQVVMTGSIREGDFHCDKIQMKCPSKYKQDQVAIGAG